MKRIAFATVVLGVVLAMAACTAAEDPAAGIVVTDSAGVTIVANTSTEDTPLAFVAEPVLRLGGKDAPEESFFRVGRTNVAADARGNLYVLDRSLYQVQVFDSTGQHLRSLGSQGNGPGEVQFPFEITVSDAGDLWVMDLGARSLKHWGPEGDLLEPRPVEGVYSGDGVRWTAEGFLIEMTDDESRTLFLNTFAGDADARPIVRMPRAEMRFIDLECGIQLSGLEPIFSPSLVWTSAGASLVAVRSADYAIDFFEGGTLVRSVRRGGEPRTATAALAEASLNGGMRIRIPNGELMCASDDVVSQQGFAPYLPALAALAIAPDGTLWAQRYEVGEAPRPIDIFDPEGRYVGTLPPGTPFPVGFLPDGRLLISETDELDVSRLVVLVATLEGG
jgi:hypothetical protein